MTVCKLVQIQIKILIYRIENVLLLLTGIICKVDYSSSAELTKGF